MYWLISHQQRLGAEILSITSICIVSLLFQFVKAHNPFSQSTAAFLLLAAYYLLLIQQTCVDWVKNSRLLLFFLHSAGQSTWKFYANRNNRMDKSKSVHFIYKHLLLQNASSCEIRLKPKMPTIDLYHQKCNEHWTWKTNEHYLKTIKLA